MDILLDRGVNFNAFCYSDYVALTSAAQIGDKSLVQCLLDPGTEVNTFVKGSAVLFYALGRGDELTRLLIKRGADLKAKNNQRLTPLLFTVALGFKSTVKIPLQYKVAVDVEIDSTIPSSVGFTAL